MMPRTSALTAAMALVAPAEQAFRSRWRFSTLVRANVELATLVQEQITLYDAACIDGTDADLALQAAAMVRGWRAACAALEAPLVQDDAYHTGQDLRTGLTVVIGDHRGSIGRVQDVAGKRVVFVTPDEVARLVAGIDLIATAKNLFPDAEVIERYPALVDPA